MTSLFSPRSILARDIISQSVVDDGQYDLTLHDFAARIRDPLQFPPYNRNRPFVVAEKILELFALHRGVLF